MLLALSSSLCMVNRGQRSRRGSFENASDQQSCQHHTSNKLNTLLISSVQVTPTLSRCHGSFGLSQLPNPWIHYTRAEKLCLHLPDQRSNRNWPLSLATFTGPTAGCSTKMCSGTSCWKLETQQLQVHGCDMLWGQLCDIVRFSNLWIAIEPNSWCIIWSK